MFEDDYIMPAGDEFIGEDTMNLIEDFKRHHDSDFCRAVVSLVNQDIDDDVNRGRDTFGYRQKYSGQWRAK